MSGYKIRIEGHGGYQIKGTKGRRGLEVCENIESISQTKTYKENGMSHRYVMIERGSQRKVYI